ncbi:helix-turn-helix transcriptional regulator [Chromatiaceae bacterium AAb-1]|nr:helix-turn-helix transcriptional regulator [Chromatiaceae bacterium AAb-1]
MKKTTGELQKAIGELIKHTRARTMDQAELAVRTGLSRSTISAMERGKGVNSKALFDVLSFLELADLFQSVVERQLELMDEHRLRKVRKEREELSNDF